MSQFTQSAATLPRSLGTGLKTLHAKAYWIIAFGVLLVALGGVAFASVLAATIVSVYVVGISMAVAGFAEIGMGFQAKSWSGFFFWILLGALYTVAGVFTFLNPLLAAGLLTLMLSAALIATGLMRIFLAFQMRAGPAWIWVALSGVITLALGAMILEQWPASSLYILGVCLSIDLLFTGFGWISLGSMLARHRRVG